MPETARATEKNLRRAERREQLLEAAVGAIREVGSQVSMEQLAAAGGVTKPILYRHFGDREGLVAAIGDKFADELVNEITAKLEGDSTDRDLLEGTINAYLAFVERDPDLYQFLVQYAVSRPQGVEVVTGLMATISQRVAIVIGEGLRNAGVDSGPAPIWAFGIVGMVHAAGNWWLDNRVMSRERLVNDLSTLLWDGLGSMGARDAAVGD